MAAAVEELIRANLPLVRTLAHRRRRTYLDPEDAVQAGTIALWRAARAFDPARGVRFGTYAYRAVLNALYALEGQERPFHEHESSLEALGRVDEGESYAEALPDPRATDPEAATVARLAVAAALDRLEAPQARVLRLRYGLEDGREWSCREVAEVLGRSRSWVSMVEAQAIRTLRAWLEGA